MIHTGICAWVLPMKERDVFQFAREVGLDGVEIDLGSNEGGYSLLDRKVQQEYLELAYVNRLQIPTLALNVLCDIGMTKADNRGHVYHVFESAIEVAVEMKIGTIQVPSFFQSFIKNEEDLFRTIECLKYASGLCEKNNLRIGTENDLSVDDNLKILEEVNSKALFVYFDTQNPFRFARRDSSSIAEALHANIGEIHAKDSMPDPTVGVSLGEGDTGFDKTMNVLAMHSYTGWIQLESEYKAFGNYSGCLDLKEMVEKDIGLIRQIFS